MALHQLENSPEGVIYKNIRSLRDENKYFDVTLVSEDGEIFAAHKLILASQSRKLNNMLSQITLSSTFSQTIIYMNGINGSELADILDFMYVGHVKISQEKLMKFLSTAQLLCVNSLTDNDSIKDESLPLKYHIDDDTNLGNKIDLEEENHESFDHGQNDFDDVVNREEPKENEKIPNLFFSGPSTKKARLSVSSVHEEFQHIKKPDQKTGTIKDGRICKLCEFVFEHKCTSVLKTHLERRHPDVYMRVIGKILRVSKLLGQISHYLG